MRRFNAALFEGSLDRPLISYGMDAPTLNGIDVPKWKCWLPLNEWERPP
jgi:hypothetical protein